MRRKKRRKSYKNLRVEKKTFFVVAPKEKVVEFFSRT
jgi:hypothetical protein